MFRVNRGQQEPDFIPTSCRHALPVCCNKTGEVLVIATSMLLGIARLHSCPMMLCNYTSNNDGSMSTSDNMHHRSALVIVRAAFQVENKILQTSFELPTEELDLLVCSALHPKH